MSPGGSHRTRSAEDVTDLRRHSRPLIVGLGSDLRGDDGVGLDVARALRGRADLAADIAEDPGDLTMLLDLWEGYARVILIDAVRSGAPAGTVHRWDLRESRTFPPEVAVSTHGISLAGALELGRSLDRLPRDLTILGIEVQSTVPGDARSQPVRDGADEVCRRVLVELGREERPHQPVRGGGILHA